MNNNHNPQAYNNSSGHCENFASAMMSESQFHASLEALVDNMPSARKEDGSTGPPPPSYYSGLHHPYNSFPKTAQSLREHRNNNNNHASNASVASSKASKHSLDFVSEDEGDRERRRQDRNLKEQQRSQMITDTIGNLKDILNDAGIDCKPDKHSTLTSIVEYIKRLQDKSTVLDLEHAKLVSTMVQTTDVMQTPPLLMMADATKEGGANYSVTAIDYQAIFSTCPFAFCILSIDGRFLDCNDEFTKVSGFERSELMPPEQQIHPETKNMSLFNIMERDDMRSIFGAMSGMMQPGDETQNYFCGQATLCREGHPRVLVHLTLARTPQGRPRYYHCTLKLLEEM